MIIKRRNRTLKKLKKAIKRSKDFYCRKINVNDSRYIFRITSYKEDDEEKIHIDLNLSKSEVKKFIKDFPNIKQGIINDIK